MTDLPTKWLAHYDPIHRGWTPHGIANGVCATNGFCFPRVAGGYNLYRLTAGEGGDVVIVGSAGANAAVVETFAWRPGRAETAYTFELRSIGGGGVESVAGEGGVAVAFDADAAPESLRPNAPRDVSVSPTAGGCFIVRWRHVERGQEVAPVGFNIYSDSGTGTIDFESPIGAVPYRLRAIFFECTAGAFAHGAAVTFAVRAVAASGADDGQLRQAWGRAVAQGPPTPTVLSELIETD